MEKITNREELRAQIALLESQCRQKEQELKANGRMLVEKLKPGNLLREGVSQFISEPGTKSKLLNTALGLGAGFLMRRFIPGGQSKVLKNAIGAALQLGVVNLVARKAGSWKEKASRIFSRKKYQSTGNGTS